MLSLVFFLLCFRNSIYWLHLMYSPQLFCVVLILGHCWHLKLQQSLLMRNASTEAMVEWWTYNDASSMKDISEQRKIKIWKGGGRSYLQFNWNVGEITDKRKQDSKQDSKQLKITKTLNFCRMERGVENGERGEEGRRKNYWIIPTIKKN